MACPDTSCTESRCCTSPALKNTIAVCRIGDVFASLEKELRGYELRKGTIQFPFKQVTVKLIGRIAKLRAAGIVATVKKPLLDREKESRKYAQ
jgi:hypothetical protein